VEEQFVVRSSELEGGKSARQVLTEASRTCNVDVTGGPMSSTTIRINAEAKGVLDRLAVETGDRPQAILGKALASYERELFLKRANEAFGKLRADKREWAAEVRERALWDRASAHAEE
jgi:predicted transcriptional regulator